MILTRQLLTLALILLTVAPAFGRGNTLLRNICRVKGQEENVLRGVGLVVGLNGTGESNDPATMRALSRSMEIMGNPISMTGRFDEETSKALKNIKNIALVMVSATIPATGARRGDQLICHVSALNGKSLEGGRLAFAALQGPNTQDRRVFANCQGAIQIDDPNQPMVGYVHDGCQMEQDVFTRFVSDDGWVTFVLDSNHADFLVASDVAERLSESYTSDYLGVTKGAELSTEEKLFSDDRQRFVHAIDAANIRVKVPPTYKGDEVAFVADLLEKTVYTAEPEARVVINTRTGSIVISGDVEIGDIVFTHRNVVVETGNAASFLPVAPGQSEHPKLQRLIDALANLKVPAQDVIEIIRGIDRMGKLHAKLIML